LSWEHVLHLRQPGIFGGDEKVRAEPFEEVEIDLAEWWEGEDGEE
jgi:hypothetical protein